ncbi:hypothetical protein AAHE18_03G080500 [Arachis hypogaea]
MGSMLCCIILFQILMSLSYLLETLFNNPKLIFPLFLISFFFCSSFFINKLPKDFTTSIPHVKPSCYIPFAYINIHLLGFLYILALLDFLLLFIFSILFWINLADQIFIVKCGTITAKV